MPKLVVSYRRADTGPIAGRIFDRLSATYGSESVFMDVDNIPFGVDFREHIQQELSQCDILIVIIGPRWMGVSESGKTRLSDETDPVRIEVETAMRSRVPIIPILVDNASMPKATELPDSLRDFAFRNAAEVDAAGRDFRQHMDRVVRSIDQILERNGKPAAPVKEPPRAQVGLFGGNRNWAIGVALGAMVVVGGAALMAMLNGNQQGVTRTKQSPESIPQRDRRTETPLITAQVDDPPPLAGAPPPGAPPPAAAAPPPTPAKPVSAQPATDYPTRAITTIVPFVAGGATDLIARLAGEYISKSVGQRVIVENKPGAGGAIGMEAVVKSAPDGYTLGMYSATDVLSRYVGAKLNYDPLKDLVPVGIIGRTALVIVVPASSSAKTLPEFIAQAKANPGKLTYASSGDFTASHLSAAQMARAAGINLRHVKYPGLGPAIADLFAGRVSIMHVSPTVRADVQAGRLRALAIVGPERWPEAFPNVPSTKELGLAENDFDMWYGMVAPRGTPEPIVGKLNLSLRQMTADSASRESSGKIQVRPVSMTASEFAATIDAYAPKLEKLVKDLSAAKD